MRISRVYPCNVRSQPRCVKEGGRVSHESLFSLGNLAQPTTPWWKYRSCAHSYLEPRTGNKAEALLSDRIMYAVPREGGNSATKRCRLEGKGDYAGEWKSGNLGRVLGGGTSHCLLLLYYNSFWESFFSLLVTKVILVVFYIVYIHIYKNSFILSLFLCKLIFI